MFPLVSYPGTMVALEDRTKETYFANLKGSRRHNLKKKLKKSRQNLTADIEVVQNPDPKTMDEIFSLFWQTYEKGKTKFERLNPLFFSKVAEFEGSYFVLVRDSKDKKMVAFMLCFNVGDRVINKFIGIDYSLPAECYLYFRLYEAALDWVLTTKAVEFQSGQTGYRAKIDLGNSLVPLTNYCKHRNPLMNRIYALVSQDVSWLTLDEDLATYLKAHPEEMLPLPKLPAPAPKTPAICNR
jgi:predicted N-acyltransferase